MWSAYKYIISSKLWKYYLFQYYARSPISWDRVGSLLVHYVLTVRLEKSECYFSILYQTLVYSHEIDVLKEPKLKCLLQYFGQLNLAKLNICNFSILFPVRIDIVISTDTKADAMGSATSYVITSIYIPDPVIISTIWFQFLIIVSLVDQWAFCVKTASKRTLKTHVSCPKVQTSCLKHYISHYMEIPVLSSFSPTLLSQKYLQ